MVLYVRIGTIIHMCEVQAAHMLKVRNYFKPLLEEAKRKGETQKIKNLSTCLEICEHFISEGYTLHLP